MELRFFVGYIVGVGVLAFLHYYEFGVWMAFIICLAVYASTRYIAHSLFDK